MKTKTFSVPATCIALAVACFLVGTGCTTMRKEPPASKKSSEPYRVEQEGKIPPITAADVKKQADQEEKYEDLPVTEEEVKVEEFTPPQEPVAAPDSQGVPAPAAAPRETMMGYRVQVFASGNEAAARSVKEALEVSIGVPAYVELIDGVYKVRAGDCPSRPEAETLLAKCRAAGYGDAWIATSKILLPAKKKTP
jgi:septal ring-binding cell division protein DamX